MTEFFKFTSAADYDRHTYEVVTTDNKRISFENWEDVQRYWSLYSINLNTVLVKDRKLGFGK